MNTNSRLGNFVKNSLAATAMTVASQGKAKGQEPAFPRAYNMRTIPSQVLGTNPLPPIVQKAPAQLAAPQIVGAGNSYQLDPNNDGDKTVINLLEKMYSAKGINADTKKPSIISFSTHWCPPCRTLEPILEQIKKDQAQNDFLKNFNLVVFKSTKPSEAQKHGTIKTNDKEFPKVKDSSEFGPLEPLAKRISSSFPRAAQVYKQNGRWTITDLTKAVQSRIRTNDPQQVATSLKNALNGAVSVHMLDSKIK